MSRMLYGKNPVLEAIRHSQKLIQKIYLDSTHKNKLEYIAISASKNNLSVEWIERDKLDRIAGTKDHQGVAAMLAGFPYTSLKDFLTRKSIGPRTVVLLDDVFDPMNLGAIIRAMATFGADLLIIPKIGACQITPVVSKASAGGTEILPIARETNIASCIEKLKKTGFWIAALTLEGATNIHQSDLSGDIAFVAGSEGKGIRERVSSVCDFKVWIPTGGKLSSLNVSQAVACALMERYRQIAARQK